MICPNYSVFRSQFATTTTRAADGYEVWNAGLIRTHSFDDGIAGIYSSEANQQFPISLTVNGYAADAVASTDEYDWYVSQRTDVAASQYLAVTAYPNLAGSTYSGSIRLSLTAFAIAELDLDDGTELDGADLVKRVLSRVYVYVQRRSDDSIQYVELYEATKTAPAYIIS